ncbi:uncharacterized protein [Henckelia pumila]|uniref:uncharacterized protein n=1 Tax=Henckelia pumila TaxID=405737 RepID=UPI003C6E4CB7
MDLLTDYDCEIKYHPGSSNPVVDALSRKVYVSSLRTSSVAIGMAPFEALYGCRCRTPLFWDEIGKRQVEGPQMIQEMTDVVELIRKRIKVMRFGLKGKLSPRFICPFEILEKYVADESHILHLTEVQLDQDLSYVERPLRILDRKDKVIRNKSIPLVMVQWQRRGTEEATWELESWMRAEHPELF